MSEKVAWKWNLREERRLWVKRAVGKLRKVTHQYQVLQVASRHSLPVAWAWKPFPKQGLWGGTPAPSSGGKHSMPQAT